MIRALTGTKLDGKMPSRGGRMEKEKFDQIKYIAQYNKENVIYKRLSFNRNKPEDMELLEWIESRHEPISGYLKRLATQDMKSNKE